MLTVIQIDTINDRERVKSQLLNGFGLHFSCISVELRCKGTAKISYKQTKSEENKNFLHFLLLFDMFDCKMTAILAAL